MAYWYEVFTNFSIILLTHTEFNTISESRLQYNSTNYN